MASKDTLLEVVQGRNPTSSANRWGLELVKFTVRHQAESLLRAGRRQVGRCQWSPAGPVLLELLIKGRRTSAVVCPHAYAARFGGWAVKTRRHGPSSRNRVFELGGRHRFSPASRGEQFP